ncbi:MAG: hypothetical protein A2Y73_09280 [Chloroflexi bacterium RBG_13_56_8]|nr:MAG: hypothetical protein A2Y73_09280 [Chloroflexi bacterium RBG_13_56_8]
MASQKRGEQTHSRILDAAAECFARSGYDGTSVSEVCAHAGVTKGAFYHHFPSKQVLFLELLDRWLGGLDAQLALARIDAKTVPQALLDMAGLAGQIFELASGQLPLFLEFWSKAARDPEVWAATIAPYRRYRTFFANLIEAGMAEGTLQQTDPDVVAQVIVSLSAGLVLQGLLDPDGADWGEVAQQGMRMLVEGLKRRN